VLGSGCARGVTLLGAYPTVVALLGLWDSLPQLVGIMTGQGLNVLLTQGAVGVAGLAILWVRWREAVRRSVALS
jgi:hypothetical protein